MKKNKKKIGIIKNNTYYKYKYFFNRYYNKIGGNVIYYQEKKVLNNDIESNNMIDIKCNICRHYINEYDYLYKKADYIIISIDNYNNCPEMKKLNNMYKSKDSKNLYLDLSSNKVSFIYSLIKSSLKITINIPKILFYLTYFLIKNKIYFQNQTKFEFNKLNKNTKKVLIITNDYIIENIKLINNYLEILKKQNVEYVISNRLVSSKIDKYYQYSHIHCQNKSLKNHTSSFYFTKNNVDGIVFITNNDCSHLNSLRYLLSYYNKDIKILNINLNNSKEITINQLNYYLNLIQNE